MTSGFDQLERELLDAARRQAGGERRQRGGGARRVLPWSGAAVPVFGVVIAIVIAAGALVLTGGQRARLLHSPGARPGAQALVGELGILRQPQTAAARAYNSSKYVTRGSGRRPQRRLIPSLTRLVRLPDGGKLFLYVVSSTGLDNLGGLGFTELSKANGFGSCCLTPGDLRSPTGPGPDAYASGAHPTQLYFEIVPDHVALVRWTFPRVPQFPATPAAMLTRPFPTSLTVNVAVHNNVAAVMLPQRGTVTHDTWYAANGHVIANYSSTKTKRRVTTAHALEEVLDDDGIGDIRFGQRPQRVVAGLTRLLGQPEGASTGQRPNGLVRSICGFDYEIDWMGLPAQGQYAHSSGLVVYFRNSRFAGYSYGPEGELGTPVVRQGVTLATSKGLRLDQPLSGAQRLYGRAFVTTTQEQGTPPNPRLERLPVWRVKTASRSIYGFIEAPNGINENNQRTIGSISAGSTPNTPCKALPNDTTTK